MLKQRMWLGNSCGGEWGRRGLPRQLVTQRQAHHRNTLNVTSVLLLDHSPPPSYQTESYFRETEKRSLNKTVNKS